MPIPMYIVDGGPAAVSVTLNVPVCATLKLCKPVPKLGCTVPANVSVIDVAGVVMADDDVEFEPLQAAAPIASASKATRVCFMGCASCKLSAIRLQRFAAAGDLFS